MRSLKRSKNRDTFPLTLFFQKRFFFVLSYPRRALCVQRVSLSSRFSRFKTTSATGGSNFFKAR